jgi:uncharacterized protein (TIGR02679 family)
MARRPTRLMETGDLGSLARDELAPLWAAARRRLERVGLTFGTTPIRLTGLTPAERDAIGGLIGQRRAASGAIKVDLTRLDEQLLRARTVGVIAVLETLGGPLVDRRAERSTSAAAVADGWRAVRGHPAVTRASALADWTDLLRRTGRLRRLGLDDPFTTLLTALDIVEPLPSSPTQLAVLAAQATGDAHALDTDRPLGVLATEAVQAMTGIAGRRAAWRAVGIELDAVSASVLALGLRGHAVLDAAADVGEPVRITWRLLEKAAPAAAGSVVWVCENPVVVDAAASELGRRCRPMVCTDGMPSGVVWHLLDQLRAVGVEARVHADFDVGGLRIVGAVLGRTDAVPWRFDTAAYLDALDGPSSTLTGPPPATPWDPKLCEAMSQHRRAVHEEALLAVLLADLS